MCCHPHCSADLDWKTSQTCWFLLTLPELGYLVLQLSCCLGSAEVLVTVEFCAHLPAKNLCFRIGGATCYSGGKRAFMMDCSLGSSCGLGVLVIRLLLLMSRCVVRRIHCSKMPIGLLTTDSWTNGITIQRVYSILKVPPSCLNCCNCCWIYLVSTRRIHLVNYSNGGGVSCSLRMTSAKVMSQSCYCLHRVVGCLKARNLLLETGGSRWLKETKKLWFVIVVVSQYWMQMTPHRFDLCRACLSYVCSCCRNAIEPTTKTVEVHCSSNFATIVIDWRHQGWLLAKSLVGHLPMLSENLAAFLKLSMVWTAQICWRGRAACC